jgi:hypothetical protein
MGRRPKLPTLGRVYKPGCITALVDRRQLFGRTAVATLGAMVQDLGGPDQITVAQAALAERAVFLHMRCRELESRYANGEPLDHKEYTALTNALCAALGRLGLNRVAKDAGTLDEFIRRDGQ